MTTNHHTPIPAAPKQPAAATTFNVVFSELDEAIGNVPASVPGAISIYAGVTAPSGWLFSYGQSLDTTAYAALFAVTGYTYGGAGASFNLPDLRGRYALPPDDMGGVSANRVIAAAADTVGASAGAEAVTLSEAQMPAHNHQAEIDGQVVTVDDQGGGSTSYTWGTTQGLGDGEPVETDSSGGGGSHDNMPPYITLNYIIFTGV